MNSYIIDLIEENKFQELKDKLSSQTEGFAIHAFLLNILNDKDVEVTGDSFDATRYQEEFIEGLTIYTALIKSDIDKSQLESFKNVLVRLAFKMSEFVMLMAKQAMQHGAHLTELSNLYEVKPEIRGRLQKFIDILQTEVGESKTLANLAAAKAKVSNSIGNILHKYEIGEDMLQFAKSYTNIGEIEMATELYRGIMNDFEASNNEKEFDIYYTAKACYELMKDVMSDDKEKHISTDEGLFNKIKKWFKK